MLVTSLLYHSTLTYPSTPFNSPDGHDSIVWLQLAAVMHRFASRLYGYGNHCTSLAQLSAIVGSSQAAIVRDFHRSTTKRSSDYQNAKFVKHGDKKNHYDILGIAPGATKAQIKTAYIRLSKVYHPDKNNSPEARVQWGLILEAYEKLRYGKTRKEYDSETFAQDSILKKDALRKEELKKQSGFYMHEEQTRKKDSHLYSFEDIQRLPYLRQGKLKSNRLSQREATKQQLSNQMLRIIIFLLIFVGMTATATRE